MTTAERAGWDALAAAVMADDDREAHLLGMRQQLQRPTEPREFCAVTGWTNLTQRRNFPVGTCTRPAGHTDDPTNEWHLDVHTGNRWRNRMETADRDTSPMTAADFEMKYDEQHTFPFFEDADARIFGYGHPDKADAARQVREYYEHGDPAGGPYLVGPEDVQYRWAVRDGVDSDGEPRFRYGHDRLTPVTADEPGAFPIWTVQL